MLIRRVSVEEGFLDGLELELDAGLSVLIGARGCGKTSIIELIRFGLGSPATSPASLAAAELQVAAVLGSGKVAVTVDDGTEEVTYSRAAGEDAPRSTGGPPRPTPIVLSQSEIEQVGRHADARVRLLDGFLPLSRESERSEDAARALIASLTVELRSVHEELRAAGESAAAIADVEAHLLEARAVADAAVKDLEATADDRARLEAISQSAAVGAVKLQEYARAETVLAGYAARIDGVASYQLLDPWPASAGEPDALISAREGLASINSTITMAAEQLAGLRGQLAEARQAEEGRQIVREDEARTLRGRINELSDGAGRLIKRVSDLDASRQRLLALRERIIMLREKSEQILARREEELDSLDVIRETRLNSRERVAETLNAQLGPRVRIVVNRFGSTERYSELLASALRGSGVQYNTLAPTLAGRISPRELATAAENNVPEIVVDATGITLERAQRIVGHLRDVGTETIITAPLEDTVQLFLLDGGTYKPSDELSVGQRCTVVLPIVLSHSERVIIVDQPEDNLDNSFIAETLVKAIKNRPTGAQLIFATHNANIPVLGEADRVVFLKSDGKRGEIFHAGELDDPQSVRAISDVMEGGREAFESRALFYSQENE